jgi:DNA-binding transcriptional MerR regulator
VEATLLIGQLSERVGVSTKTIRYYEEVGLLPRASRSEGGYRLYSVEDEGRLQFVASARRVGFALGEIKEMLALRERGRPPCGTSPPSSSAGSARSTSNRLACGR